MNQKGETEGSIKKPMLPLDTALLQICHAVNNMIVIKNSMFLIKNNSSQLIAINQDGKTRNLNNENTAIPIFAESLYLNADIMLEAFSKLKKLNQENNNGDERINKLHDTMIEVLNPLFTWCEQFTSGIRIIRNKQLAHRDEKSLTPSRYFEEFILPVNNDLIALVLVSEFIVDALAQIHSEISDIHYMIKEDCEREIKRLKPKIDLDDSRLETITNIKISNLDDTLKKHCINKLRLKFVGDEYISKINTSN